MPIPILPRDKNGNPFEVMGFGQTYRVNVGPTATTVLTATQGLQTNCIRIFQVGVSYVHVRVGVGATAVTTDPAISASLPEYIKCDRGDTVSVLGGQATATGIFWVTECV